jgi:glycosyltransferase involved in cell wall biosynthesis
MKFSIVTPTHNSERYIRETIESVIKQKGEFSIEYFIFDNHSVDDTCSIVRRYQQSLAAGEVEIFCHDVQLHLVSEKDSGMYGAIKNGFARAAGDVYAWINSDDIYLAGAFDIVQRSLDQYPKILWLKGITSYINENSTIYSVGRCNLYRQDLIGAGVYGPILNFIQQDSVFWRSELWEKSGGVDEKYSLAGDYFLWKEFSKYTPLYSLNAYVSCFRKRPHQKSENINAYFQEIENCSGRAPFISNKLRQSLAAIELLPRRLRPHCYRLMFGLHMHHLLLLENGVIPRLIEGEYFALRDML